MAVRLQLTGPSVAAVRTLAVTRRWAGRQGITGIGDLQVSDDSGPIGAEIIPAEGRVKLQRSARGPRLTASYSAAANHHGSRFDVQLDSRGFTGVGHRFLLLPELNKALRTHLRWDLSALPGPSPTAACSLGFGPDIVGVMSPPDLMNSVFVAGSLQVLDGGFGERLVARKPHRLDLPEALRLSSRILFEGRKLLSAPRGEHEPVSVFLLPVPGMARNHEGASLSRSLGLWFDEQRTLDGDLRIALAHELIHRHIGSWLRLEDRRDNRDTKWFSEGFTEHYARELLWRLRAITAGDVAGHVSRLRRAQQAALEGRRPALPVAYFRGALYAIRLAAQLKGRGSSLDELLVALADRARDGRPISLRFWQSELSRRLGPAAVTELDRLVIRAEAPIELPEGSLGPCFEVAPSIRVRPGCKQP